VRCLLAGRGGAFHAFPLLVMVFFWLFWVRVVFLFLGSVDVSWPVGLWGFSPPVFRWWFSPLTEDFTGDLVLGNGGSARLRRSSDRASLVFFWSQICSLLPGSQRHRPLHGSRRLCPVLQPPASAVMCVPSRRVASTRQGGHSLFWRVWVTA
jgi:hypothetical protein